MQKPRKKTRPGQADIAETLGVSVSTVSRALAGSPLINESVKRQVRQVALKIGYQVKGTFEVEKFDSVYVLTSLAAFSDMRSSMYVSLLDGIREEGQRFGVEVTTAIAKSRTPMPEAIDSALGPKAACVFLGITPDSETVQSLVDRQIPAIICNGVDETLQVDSISPANFFGARLMTEYLVSQGHRKFLYVAGSDRATLRLRYLGFEKYLEQRFAELGTQVLSVFENAAFQTDEDAAGFRRWIEADGGEATALFCFNDGAAVWAMEQLQAMGLSVPRDMSVVGFDDVPVAQISNPGLTTFRIDWTQIGRQTVQLLHKRMLSPGLPAEILQISGRLVTRDSVRRI